VAETSSLLNCRSSKGYRGFESPLLRLNALSIMLRAFFCVLYLVMHTGAAAVWPPAALDWGRSRNWPGSGLDAAPLGCQPLVGRADVGGVGHISFRILVT
jgi:hypothetical protein